MALTVNVVASVLLETVVSVYARVVLELIASVALTASVPRKVWNAVYLDLANVVSFIFMVSFYELASIATIVYN